jgi:hypothetical protein
LRTQYDGLPLADFSRDLLGVSAGLFVRTWPTSMGWSDLGTPDRLARWRLAHQAKRPPTTSARADQADSLQLAY